MRFSCPQELFEYYIIWNWVSRNCDLIDKEDTGRVIPVKDEAGNFAGNRLDAFLSYCFAN